MTDVKLENISIDGIEENQEEQQHDQLPTVEEIKAQHMPVARSSCQLSKPWALYICIATATLLLLVLTATGVTLGKVPSRGATNESLDTKNSTDDNLGTTSVGQVIKFLSQYSDLYALNNATSPQRRAAEWMVHRDAQNVLISSPRFLQRYALMVFYFATQGSKWKFDIGFAHPKRDECNWKRLFRRHGSEDSFEIGVVCNNNRQVTEVNLGGFGLSGYIPSEIGLLSRLTQLSLDNNNLKGRLPRGLSRARFLSSLTIGYNKFDIKIPSWIGKLSNLRVLSLTGNHFKSAIPSELSTLKQLEILALDHNQLSGNVTVVMQGMTKLIRVYLQNNQFSDTIGLNTFSALTDLRSLDLSNNKIAGRIDASLLFKEKLEVLSLDGNFLSGPIPSISLTSSSLNYLSLVGNALTGDISPSLAGLENLRHLHLSSNRFQGNLSDSLGQLTMLRGLHLSDNALLTPGPVPSFLKGMHALRTLSLGSTRRTGVIPTWMGEMQNLVALDLEYNDLHSTIPSQLGHLVKLQSLRLEGNKLSGPLPNQISNLNKLRELMLNNNTLSGEAGSLCNIPSLHTFVTDCLVEASGSSEFNCTCCTHCCSDLAGICNNNFEAPPLVPTGYARHGVPPYYESGSLAVVTFGQESGK